MKCRIFLVLLPLLSSGLLPSCTMAISKTTKTFPEIPDGATIQQVHQALGEPVASHKIEPAIPLSKDPVLPHKGASLVVLNDKRPVGLREEFRLKGRYRREGDPDGLNGLADLSAKGLWVPEIVLGPFATLDWAAHQGHRTKVIVWYSPQGKKVFVWRR